ncbi:MAG: LPXTG cell wall anchor domain-containing protein [Clostridia bacterium]|nr:LPXTG cell wall anchor domain-containing protein [Clostridia bacterium]
MKRKFFKGMACLMIAWLILMTSTVLAEDVDILRVSIQADKAQYRETDTAKLTITVENTSDHVATDVSIANLLPNGLQYAPQQRDTTFRHTSIAPHSSVQHEVYVQLVNTKLPQTGDRFWSMPVYAAITVICAALIVVLRKKKMDA